MAHASFEMSAIVIALFYGFFFVHSYHNVLAMGGSDLHG